MIWHQTFAIMKAEARTPVAIPIDVETYLAQKAEALDQKLREVGRRLETSRGDTRIGAKGLRIPAVRTTETEAAIAFARRVATAMPPIRLTDLVADIDRFQFLIRTPPDRSVSFRSVGVLCGADRRATNLGFSKMAHACPGITRRQLQQLVIWHFREETFALALAKLVEAQHSAPFSTVFGSHAVSSPDRQHIRLGDGGEVAGGVNGRYGNNPIVKLYTAISGRYAPFIPKSSPQWPVKPFRCSTHCWKPVQDSILSVTTSMAAASVTSYSPSVIR
jgi:hypothetical protein